MGSDDDASESNTTHYSAPPPVADTSGGRSVPATLSRADSRDSEYGNVFRGVGANAGNYGVLPSVLPPAMDPNNPSYNNLPRHASAPSPRSPAQATSRATLMKVIYDKIIAPVPSVIREHGYDVVKPHAPPGAGGTYNVVRALRSDGDDGNSNYRGSISVTVHDEQAMEVLDDVTLDSSGSGASSTASDSSAERRRNGDGGAIVPRAGRNQYEAMASRLTLSPLPTAPALPPTMRAPIIRDAKK